MSGNSSLPIFTIDVGTPNQFNNDADVDISSTLNAEIAAAPVGDQVDVVFNPGNYGVANTILLRSNTTVIGNGAELGFLPGANGGSSTNGGALIGNAGAYATSNNFFIENPNGSYTEDVHWQSNTQLLATTYSALIINTNISVSGLVFNETGSETVATVNSGKDSNSFGTWFINATNVNVSNNVYLGGNDGNAFTNVDNGVVSNNIAIGNLCAFDNWNGSSNISILDNQVWQKSKNDNSAFAGVQLNSTPNGNPATGGDASNDAVIGDSFAGNTIWQSAVNSDPLLDHGVSSESQITEEGNVDTSLGGYTQGFYSSGPIAGLEVTDNVVTGAVVPETESGLIDAVGAGITDASISGNLVYDASAATSSTALILAPGPTVSVTGNASISESVDGQVGALVTNATVGDESTASTELTAWIEVPADLVTTNQAQMIQGVSLGGESADTTLTLSVTAQFGTVSSTDSTDPSLLNGINSAGQSALTITGTVAKINQELSTLVYTPTAGNDTDAIEFIVSNSADVLTTSYIPVVNETLLSIASDVVTMGSGFIAPSDSYSANGATGDTAEPPSLSGDILAVVSGNNVLNMSSVASLAYLGTGTDTVIGGSLDEYIAAGAGSASIELGGGGNVTFVGSSGSSTVNALSGEDLIEAGSGAMELTQGSNAVSVIGGLGTLDYAGGSGSSFITTLPENAGNLNAQLGSGNSTVEALSGNDTISTEVGTTNLIVLGSGTDSVNSSGDDVIYAGTSNDTINLNASSLGTVVGGGGQVTAVYDGKVSTFLATVNVAVTFQALSNAILSEPPPLLPGITLTSQGHDVNTIPMMSVTDEAGDNMLTVSGASALNDIAGNDTVQVVAQTYLLNSSISGAKSPNTINFVDDDLYNSSSAAFLSSDNVLNLAGNDQTVIYAANQDTVNMTGAGNAVMLEPDSAIPSTNQQATMKGGSSLIKVSGSSTALVETAGNNIIGADGAQLIVGGGDNTITGQNIDAQISGAGNKVILTGSDTVTAASPYSYESTNVSMAVQNEMTVQSGQFVMGGLDQLDQTSGTAAISLFGGNKVTLDGSRDSIIASDQIYVGNSMTNNGAGNAVALINTSNAATTITANASTLVNMSDNRGTVIGGGNNNSDESLTFIAGTGTSNTIFGAGSNASITLFGGQSAGNIVYGGSQGGNSLNGAAGGGDLFVGGGDGDVLIGGASGNNTLAAGAGSETLVGAGLGNDLFSVGGGGGSDVVQNFTGSLTVNSGLSVTSQIDLAGSLVVSLSDSTRITFLGVSNLTQSGNIFTMS